MSWEFAQSTPTAASLARCVSQHYALGDIVHAEFLRRSFNQVHRLRLASGQQVIARLSAERPRGAPDGAFEHAVLAHCANQGVAVARCLPTREGAHGLTVPLPEGPRTLMLFEHIEGVAGNESAEDLRAFAAVLADLHAAGACYRGPASRYALDLIHLLLHPLECLLRAPTMTAALRPVFAALGARLQADIECLGPLTQVLCHGDAHGSNHFIVRAPLTESAAIDRAPAAPAGRSVAPLRAVLFDFDDAGFGPLAFDLAVFAWALHPRTPDGVWSEKAGARWQSFISAYDALSPLGSADWQALPCFVAVRQFWLLGEYAGRAAVWGTQAIPTD